jgi:peptide/nickel transport system substrate-binding protein
MLGWGLPTYDSGYIFNFLVHGRDDKYGSRNGTPYDNPELNAKIERLASNTDLEARNADIAAIWKVVQDEKLYIPLYHQVLNWGLKSNVQTVVEPDDSPKIKYFRIN